MPCAPLSREAGPRWTVFGIRAYHVDEVLVTLAEELLGKGIGFRSLLDGAIDTTTASGKLMFNIFSSGG